ncbi:hypothetical protein KIL84_015622, partial [Mauremys mutica]
ELTAEHTGHPPSPLPLAPKGKTPARLRDPRGRRADAQPAWRTSLGLGGPRNMGWGLSPPRGETSKLLCWLMKNLLLCVLLIS